MNKFVKNSKIFIFNCYICFKVTIIVYNILFNKWIINEFIVNKTETMT